MGKSVSRKPKRQADIDDTATAASQTPTEDLFESAEASEVAEQTDPAGSGDIPAAQPRASVDEVVAESDETESESQTLNQVETRADTSETKDAAEDEDKPADKSSAS